MSKVWTDQKERSNPLTMRIICKFAQVMPRRVARLLLWPVTLYYFLIAANARAVSRNYLKRIPGKCGKPSEVFAHLYTFSSVVLDRVYFLTDKFDKFNIDLSGAEVLQTTLTNKQGAILLGAHIGSFEAMRCLAIRHAHLPLKIMMHHDHNAMVMRVVDELNPEVAKSVINLSEQNALLQAKESLEAGYLIGMLGDRVLPTEKSIATKFLGKEVLLPAGPITLAAMLGVPVILFFGIYTGGNNYRIQLQLLSEGQQLARKERDDMVADLTQEYVNRLEDILIRYPYNWFNFYDYWSDEV